MITALIPVLFFVGLELILRLFSVGEPPQTLVINSPYNDNYYTLNPRVAERYFSDKQFATAPQLEHFEKVKSDSTIRIVVQGASSSAGFPYRNASFPKLLEQKLESNYPNHKIEVINTSIVATNSYTWLDLFDEVIDLEPDFVLIYGGHNEYYGALGVASSQSKGSNPAIVNLYLKLKDFRTVQVISGLISKINTNVNDGQSSDGTLMAKMVNEPEIEYGSELYKNGLEQYAHNMSRLFQKYNDQGISVITSNLVSNLKDFYPFSSSNKPDGAQALFDKGAREFDKENIQRAKELFSLSRDYDLLRFRASSDVDSIIRSLSKEYNVEFLDVKSVFESNSPEGIIGDDLLHEHVHPKLKGQRLLADTFYKSLVGKLEGLHILPLKSISNFNYAIASVDSVYADLLIQQMMPNWPFLRGDSTEANLTGRSANVLAGAINWYQVLLDSYYEQLNTEPAKAISTAKVYLQDFPFEAQMHSFLLDAYLAKGEFDNAKEFFEKMPLEFKSENTYRSFIESSIRFSKFNQAAEYAIRLKSEYPSYRLYDRQINFLNSIILFIDSEVQYSITNKSTMLNALEAYIFFEKIQTAEEIIKLCPSEVRKDSRFISLERRLRQM